MLLLRLSFLRKGEFQVIARGQMSELQIPQHFLLTCLRSSLPSVPASVTPLLILAQPACRHSVLAKQSGLGELLLSLTYCQLPQMSFRHGKGWLTLLSDPGEPSMIVAFSHTGPPGSPSSSVRLWVRSHRSLHPWPGCGGEYCSKGCVHVLSFHLLPCRAGDQDPSALLPVTDSTPRPCRLEF